MSERRPQLQPPGARHLVVELFRTQGISDRAPAHPFGGLNIYKVIAWIDPNHRRRTSGVRSYGDPEFNQEIYVPMGTPAEYLNLEVVRGFSWKDPGTSSGTAVVGRSRIRLPPNLGVDGKVEKLAKLVAMEDGRVVPSGVIALSIDLSGERDPL